MSELAERLEATVAALVSALPPGADLERSLASVPEGDLLSLLNQVGVTRRLLDAVAARVCGELDRRDDTLDGDPFPTRMGERSLADVAARESGVAFATAQQWCTVGAAIAPRTSLHGEALPPKHVPVAEAIDDGTLTVEAGTWILRTTNQLAELAPADELDRVETFLVQQAQRLTVRELGRLCGALRDRFDPDGIEPREDRLRAKAGIRETRTKDGMTRWIMDMHPEAEGVIRTAIDAITAPRRNVRFPDPVDAVDPVKTDDRTLAQKRLDAMMHMAGDYTARDNGVRAGVKVTMVVTCELEALQKGIGRATILGVDQPISAATARRLASEAEIIPVVMNGVSEILDIGRAKRLFTEAQRVAMALRDGGCTWPGCEAPASWCEAAHAIDPWHGHGKTDIANGTLLCPFHHRRLDHDGWTFEMRAGIPYFLPPPWIDPDQIPRRGGRERLPDRDRDTG